MNAWQVIKIIFIGLIHLRKRQNHVVRRSINASKSRQWLSVIIRLVIDEIRQKISRGKFEFVEQSVTYTLEVEGKVIIIENVPARVCVETGEKLFSPETVERLQQMIWTPAKPKRIIQTPVYEFSA
jgi:YgiT-type zinc finger domain-containing protein